KCDVGGGYVGRQMDRGGNPVYVEIPAIAGDIPEKFVVILIETNLPIGGVADGVNVGAQGDHDIGIAEVDGLAVELILDAKLFGSRITRGEEHVEAHDSAGVERVLVARREIAIDAVLDLVS